MMLLNFLCAMIYGCLWAAQLGLSPDSERRDILEFIKELFLTVWVFALGAFLFKIS